MSANCPHCGKPVKLVPIESRDLVADRLRCYSILRIGFKWRGARVLPNGAVNLIRRLLREGEIPGEVKGMMDCPDGSRTVQILWETDHDASGGLKAIGINVEEIRTK